MNPIRITTLTVLAAALAACGSVPANNAMLDQARGDYNVARANSQTQALAPAELKEAGDALGLADAAFARREDTAKVDQLAYLARQRVAIAQQSAARKGSEAAVAEASAARDRQRLESRTREADVATQTAAFATRDAQSAQRQTEVAQQQAAVSRQQANEAENRSQGLQAQLADLNAKKTDRGMVITIGDVLFDTGQAQIKSGGAQSIQRLSGFLQEHPQRKALIEGYTDNTGDDMANMALSGRRADAVQAALLGMGVSPGQLTARGYGETHPVAANDSAAGRQMNRRVEIVLSDESGYTTSR